MPSAYALGTAQLTYSYISLKQTLTPALPNDNLTFSQEKSKPQQNGISYRYEGDPAEFCLKLKRFWRNRNRRAYSR